MSHKFLKPALILSFIFIFSFIPLNTNGQSLLWRVTGNGLEKPSYIYGTIHLKYDKFFEIGDSALYAIRNCDAFAGEVHYDSLVNRIYEELILDHLAGRDDENSEEQFDLNYDKIYDIIDSMITGKYDKLINSSDKYKNWKKRGVILDAFLFNIAKINNKKIYGLEDIGDHLDVVKDMSKEQKEYYDTVKNGDYYNDILNIDKLMYSYLSEDLNFISNIPLEAIHIKRNYIMRDSFIKLASKQSLFSAVGVAHLPGEEGLIELLKKEGFSVEPVKKVVTNFSRDYKIDKNLIQWKTYHNDTYGYSMDLPGTPLNLLNENSFLMLIDIGNGALIQVSCIPAMANDQIEGMRKADDLIRGFISDLNLMLVNSKDEEINNIKYKILSIFVEGMEGTIRYCYHQGTIYSFLIVNEDPEAKEYFENKFFNSIKYFPKKIEEWVHYNSDEYNFEVDFPGKPVIQDLPVDSESGIRDYKMVYKVDNMNGNEFMVMVIDYNHSHIYYNTEDAIINNVVKNINPNLEVNTTDIERYGIKGKGFIYTDDTVAVDINIFNTTNRTYFLMSHLKNPLDSMSKDKFFSAFKLHTLNNAPLVTFNYENVKVDAPGIFIKDTTNLELSSNKYIKENLYYAVDTVLNYTWFLNIDKFNKYYYCESDSALEVSVVDDFRGYSDSVLSSHIINQDGLKILEFKIRYGNSDYINLGRTIFAGGNLYTLYTTTHPEIIKNNADPIFASFEYTGPEPKWNILEDKKGLLFKALLGKDTTEKNLASKVIQYYDFKEEHLPDIFKILTMEHHDDQYNESLKSRLLNVLKEDFKDNDDVYKFIQKNDNAIAMNNNLLLAVINLWSALDTTESMDRIIDFNKKIEYGEDKGYYSYYSSTYYFYKHPERLHEYTEELIELSKDSNLTNRVIDIFNDACDENDTLTNKLSNYEQYILEICLDEYEKSKIYEEYDDYSYRSTYKAQVVSQLLLKTGQSDASKNYLKSLMADTSMELKYIGVAANIKYNEEVDEQLISEIAADKYYRNDFYNELRKQNKLSVFPDQYKNQGLIAEAEFYNYLEEYEEYCDTVYMAREIVTKVNGEDKKFYIFNFKYYTDDEDIYFGWTGPYPLTEDKDNLITESGLRNFKWEDYKEEELLKNFDSWIEETRKENEEYNN